MIVKIVQSMQATKTMLKKKQQSHKLNRIQKFEKIMSVMFGILLLNWTLLSLNYM